MPGCLPYFCAEWRQARRVVQLEGLSLEALSDVCQAVVAEATVPPVCNLARQCGLGGWRPDAAEAKGSGLPLCAEDLISAGELSSVASVGTLFSSASAKSLGNKILYSDKQLFLGALPPSGLPSPPGGKPKAKPWNKTRRKLLLLSGHGQQTTPKSLLFHNDLHPLSGLRDEYRKEEFVAEIRKRLVAERLFGSSGSSSPRGSMSAADSGPPVMSSEEAEDIFTALLLIQQPGGGSETLRMGRALDAVVDSLHSMCHFRHAMERGASSLAAFFSSLDLDNSNYLEVSELTHFLKHADSECLAGITRALASDGISVSKLAEGIFSVLDTNKDNKVERWEVARQTSLAAPPRMYLVELIGQLEMKYGVGKFGMNGDVQYPQLFSYFCEESLDMSPEDVVRFYKWVTGKGKTVLNPKAFEAACRHVPMEVTWGLEAHMADLYYASLGARALMTERARRQDAGLPAEALLEASADAAAEGGDGAPAATTPGEPELRERFGRLWERYGPHRGSAAEGGGGGGGNSGAEKQLREACCQRYLEAARALSQWRSTKAAAGSPQCVPRSLFVNISDVLATPTTRLYSGQACVIRYRLQGASNYWHPSHELLLNEKQACPWPVPRKILGDTPFIGLVPRGLTWSAGGGGGFYLGTKAFTQVDSNLRVDLPKDATTGFPCLFGRVELITPSLLRTARGADRAKGRMAEYELRLFCCTKQKIIGCIGEPLKVQVVHQFRPPPLESLQVSCDGRNAMLRWSPLDLGQHAPVAQCEVVSVRLLMRTEKSEKIVLLGPEVSEWEAKDLEPDKEYEFRVRLENSVGPGRDAAVTCRTNALCSPVGNLLCGAVGTAHVEIRWQRPRHLGNETTRDQYQQRRESIQWYEATLRVEDEDPDRDKDDADTEDGTKTLSRTCEWRSGQWREERDGTIVARLESLRPDTRYVLDGFCAVNSMGRGAAQRGLVFWTIPQTPRIAGVRIRHGFVLVALSQTGGVCVKDYAVVVLRVNEQQQAEDSGSSKKNDSTNFNLPSSNLSEVQDGGSGMAELSLPFERFPAVESNQTHTFKIRASNAGGWSDWGLAFESSVVARQQGADQAQAALIKAIESRRIEKLARTLEEVQDIEFSDDRYVHEATELLQQLRAARQILTEAITARDPGPLNEALAGARAVELPDLGKAEALLKKLETVVSKLQRAKGIEALCQALQVGVDARLPSSILEPFRETLQRREAAQQELVKAMDAARVPGLVAALGAAVGMDLPSEEAAGTLLVALQRSESLLHDALEKGSIRDLISALESADESGLKEEELVGEASATLTKLEAARDAAHGRLVQMMQRRHPVTLGEALEAARDAQVPEEELQEAAALLNHLQQLLESMKLAQGIDQRVDTLRAASASLVPEELMKDAKLQLHRLRALHHALEEGNVEGLRRALRDAETCGVKPPEMAQAKDVHNAWCAKVLEIDVASALSQRDNLANALSEAVGLGINTQELEHANSALESLQRRIQAQARLVEIMPRCIVEEVQGHLKYACDSDVSDLTLIQEAHALLERLRHHRAKARSAMEHLELQLVRATVSDIETPAALPFKELQPVRALLQQVQEREGRDILEGLDKAQHEGNFRQIDALIKRAKRASAAGVELDQHRLSEAAKASQSLHQDSRRQLENELMAQRTAGKFPQFHGSVPAGSESVPLPQAVVTGGIGVIFQHAGQLMCRLPREIVETRFMVTCGKQEGMSRETSEESIHVGLEKCAQLMETLRAFVDPEDEVHEKTKDAVILDGSDGRERRRGSACILDGRLQLDASVYIRAAHTGAEIAHVLCGQPPTASSAGLAEGGPPGIAPPPRFADYARSVRARWLRNVAFELAWTYPKGIMDTMDAACLLFDEGKLVEIVDHRGTMGFKYGVPCSPRVAAASTGSPTTKAQKAAYDTINESVIHKGSSVDSKERTGTQTIEIRLDLVPPHVTDILFVLLSSHSRDLTKFASLQVSVVDVDGGERMAFHEFTGLNTGEACIMCSLYRAPEGRWLWRCNFIGSACKGSIRDYQPILGKLLELGYPRYASLRSQVEPILSRIQQELQLPNAVKLAGCQLASQGGEDSILTRYAIELFEPDADDGARLAEHISEPSFRHTVVQAIQDCGGERYAEGHVKVLPAVSRRLSCLSLELCWEYPGIASGGAPRLLTNALDDMVTNVQTGDSKSTNVPSRTPSNVPSRTPSIATSSMPAVPHKESSTRSLGAPTLSLPSRGVLSGRQLPFGRGKDSKKSAIRATLEGPEPLDEVHPPASPQDEPLNQLLPPRNVDCRQDCSSYLDGTCVVFEGQGLRELVDYRGVHGVRIVANGVLDYKGVWMGKVGIGDATAGAVSFMGEEMDDKSCVGSHAFRVRVGAMPDCISDCFFVLSSPTRQDVSQYGRMRVIVRDAENPGHQVATCSPSMDAKAEACVMCSLSRSPDDDGVWAMQTYGAGCGGTARDYRPLLRCLRAIQESKHKEPPTWPYQGGKPPTIRADPERLPVLPRLPVIRSSRPSILHLESSEDFGGGHGLPRLSTLSLSSRDTRTSSLSATAAAAAVTSAARASSGTPRASKNKSGFMLPMLEESTSESSESPRLRRSSSRGGQSMDAWVGQTPMRSPPHWRSGASGQG